MEVNYWGEIGGVNSMFLCALLKTGPKFKNLKIHSFSNTYQSRLHKPDFLAIFKSIMFCVLKGYSAWGKTKFALKRTHLTLQK